MKQDGYSDKELQDTYMFLHVDSAGEARQLCENGARIGNSKTTTLGNPEMGRLISPSLNLSLKYICEVSAIFLANHTYKSMVIKLQWFVKETFTSPHHCIILSVNCFKALIFIFPGVHLCKHADIIKPMYLSTGTVGKIVVFKMIKVNRLSVRSFSSGISSLCMNIYGV